MKGVSLESASCSCSRAPCCKTHVDLHGQKRSHEERFYMQCSIPVQTHAVLNRLQCGRCGWNWRQGGTRMFRCWCGFISSLDDVAVAPPRHILSRVLLATFNSALLLIDVSESLVFCRKACRLSPSVLLSSPDLQSTRELFGILHLGGAMALNLEIS